MFQFVLHLLSILAYARELREFRPSMKLRRRMGQECLHRPAQLDYG